ncbi:MAG: EamA family transporter [Burkholderiales bacterium PBB3]|nr:MAG: EamA family transporter [Burkholderiales bacterium PBB3]
MTNTSSRIFPLLFVLLWSTGFIGARLGLPHIEPLTFLFIRYLAVIACMVAIALATRAPWPSDGKAWFHIGVSGLLVHGVYLGGVFIAIHEGLPAGVASLVVSVQPLLTAVGAGMLMGAVVLKRQWLGLGLGLVGVGLVVAGKLGTDFAAHALLPATVALLAITAGTLYQKRFCPTLDWRTGSVAQFVPTAVLTGALAYVTETGRIDWTGELFFALGWLVFVLSIGAVSLLNWLIRYSNAVNVASLFYLVPPCTAVVAWLLFGETFSAMALVGMGITVAGVYLARK